MQEKNNDAERKRHVEIRAPTLGSLPVFLGPGAQTQTLGLGALVSLSHCPVSKPEAIHPLLAGLSRFGEDGRAATIH